MNVQLPARITQPTQAVSRFAPDQADLIKRTICKGATDDELKMFMWQCERTGLDPFARQIYSVERREKRNDQWVTVRSIQVSIDGFRLIAERSGKYAGQVGPFWCGSDGQWCYVWLAPEPPIASRVGVLRDDFKEPCWGVARFSSYAQKTRDGSPTRMWATMPDVMLAKCAEALALRKAFPQELSGLYTSDEMDQAAERQNPHVTNPEDIVEDVQYDEQGEPIDNIPRGDARLKRLSKAWAKNEFAALQNEIYQFKELHSLREWASLETTRNRLRTLPSDWEDTIRGKYEEHKMSLSEPAAEMEKTE